MEEHGQERIDQQPHGKGSIPPTTTSQHIGFDGWMQSSAVKGNPGMLLWLLGASVVRRNDHVDTTQDDDGLEGSTKWMISWGKVPDSHERYWNTQIKSCSSYFSIMDMFCHDDSQEYNGTIIVPI
ncbi:predicted protein [Lichtheimia corymbifera JMRC:FSU:9682]|uniref:Uncharacterized protein n=1 Tax=Lichtheimia corymbifera JMRC:FSU:9682 TaxID=1263082 RepID=A0A068SB23_9FUNG|nr:predicted protein [Lichtheimia corymbifera JMRC:FSU:9682]